MTRELLVTILRGNGYDVDVASDGIEALRWIADSTFDAIIMDLQLPHLDGGGVMTVVAERWPELLGRILILTGLTLEEMRHVFPVYATLSKPFTEIRLIHEVQGCIQAWDPELLRKVELKPKVESRVQRRDFETPRAGRVGDTILGEGHRPE